MLIHKLFLIFWTLRFATKNYDALVYLKQKLKERTKTLYSFTFNQPLQTRPLHSATVLSTCCYQRPSAATTLVDFKNWGARQERPCTLVRMWHRRIIDPASCLFLWVYFTCIPLRTKFVHWKSWRFCHLSLWRPAGWFLLILHYENAQTAPFEDSSGSNEGHNKCRKMLVQYFIFVNV